MGKLPDGVNKRESLAMTVRLRFLKFLWSKYSYIAHIGPFYKGIMKFFVFSLLQIGVQLARKLGAGWGKLALWSLLNKPCRAASSWSTA